MPVIACPDCGKDVSTVAPMCPHCGRPSPAGTTPVTPAYPPAREETLWRGSPSGKILLGRLAVAVALLAVVFAVAWLVRYAAQPADIEQNAKITRIAWIVAGIILAYHLAAGLVTLVKLRSTMYTVTNQRVMIESGLFSKHLGEIDLRYIDDTMFSQRFVERVLGIGNVTLVSTDKTSPTQVLRGVDDPRSLRELIRSHAYQVSQRQVFTRAT